MKNTIFKGMATAIVTPMTKTDIDYEALGRFIEFQIDNGINAIVVMGTTGENATIEPEDQKKVIAFTVERSPSVFPSLRAPAPIIPSMFCTTPRPPAKWVPMLSWW